MILERIRKPMARFTVALFAAWIWSTAAGAQALVSFAFINDDGTLKMRGRIIHLYGIYIPPTGTTCQSFQRPVKCGSRAALALEFKKGANFVRCEPRTYHVDASVTAVCTVNGDDLAAYLLERGWAVALPDAPFEYQTLERIAEKRGMGVWGIAVDNIPGGVIRGR